MKNDILASGMNLCVLGIRIEALRKQLVDTAENGKMRLSDERLVRMSGKLDRLMSAFEQEEKRFIEIRQTMLSLAVR